MQMLFLLAVFAVLGGLVRWGWKTMQLQKKELEGEDRVSAVPDLPSASQPVSVEGLRVVRTTKLPREALIDELRRRSTEGLCIVCQARASKPMPVREVKTLPFSSVIRWLGAVPRERVVIDPHPWTSSGPFCLCVVHHELAVKRMEAKVLEHQQEQAAFVARQRDEWMTFQRFGVLESLRDHEQVVMGHNGTKKRKGAPALEAVPRLPRVTDSSTG